jgi:hypothetical protein
MFFVNVAFGGTGLRLGLRSNSIYCGLGGGATIHQFPSLKLGAVS